MKYGAEPSKYYESARYAFVLLRQRWRDPAMTILAILLAVEMFIIAPLHVVGLPTLFSAPFVIPMLIAAVIAASENTAAVFTVIFGTFLIVAATVLHLSGNANLPIYIHLIAFIIVGFALFWVVAYAVFAPGRVTYHRIVGTLLLYLTIGAIFAGIYGIVGLLVSHAFKGMPPRDDTAAVVAHVLYFSFSTLTTAGYGDITPMHPVTRGLSNLEAVAGQLFPATLIARIVTLHLADRNR